MKLDKEKAVARQAADEAGNILKRLFGEVTQVTKKGERELLTEADLRSEKAILDIISHHFPQDGIITEEGGEYNLGRDRVWLIDPLDGTTNYAHKFPFFGISMALEVEKEPILGIVFNPCMDEYFEAIKGDGAFLNNRPIRVSQVPELGESLLATGFSYDIHQDPHKLVEIFKKMLVRAQSTLRPGSAALDLCYVGCGIFDAFWEEGLKPWDTAAGMVILEEAGGRLSTFEGNPYSPYEKSIVASNSLIHEAMLEVINR